MPRRYADWRSLLKPEVAEKPQQLDAQEARVISAWGLTLAKWKSLTEVERARLRFDYLKAPNFVA